MLSRSVNWEGMDFCSQAHPVWELWGVSAAKIYISHDLVAHSLKNRLKKIIFYQKYG